MRYKHIYGPVLSRRLGRSLGVDVIPFKTCSYDCIYCLLGRTTTQTTELKEYVSKDLLLDEPSRKLAEDRPDAISFAGSGEPTLNSALGEVVHEVKRMSGVPVVVFTNSSLLWMPEVRENLREVDIVSPSLDAARPESAQAVNRLAPGLDYPTVYKGLQDFCADFKGRIWLEILLASGVNDGPEDLEALRGAVEGLVNLERIQLNTVVRPPAEKHVGALGRARLERIASGLPGRVEIIGSPPEEHLDGKKERRVSGSEVSDLIRRHPSTLEGVAQGLGVSEAQARRVVKRLLDEGVLEAERRGGEVYYVAAHPL